MRDIVERLREYPRHADQGELRDEAADEIERLRSDKARLRRASQSLVDEWNASFAGQKTGFEGTHLHHCVKMARAALEATR